MNRGELKKDERKRQMAYLFLNVWALLIREHLDDIKAFYSPAILPGKHVVLNPAKNLIKIMGVPIAHVCRTPWQRGKHTVDSTIRTGLGERLFNGQY
jgi:hypothetical protein